MQARHITSKPKASSTLFALSHRVVPGGSNELPGMWLGVRLAIILFLAVLGTACAVPVANHKPPFSQVVVKPTCERLITAEVVALDQVYYYNRFGSFNPAGIMYALRRDVVLGDLPDPQESEVPTIDNMYKRKHGDLEIVNGDLDEWESEGTAIPAYKKENEANDRKIAGHVKLRSDKRPRPLVLRANEGDCLQVTFTNLLAPSADGQEVMNNPEFRLTHPDEIGGEASPRIKVRGTKAIEKGGDKIRDVSDGDEPTTRHASMHVNGLSLVDSIDSQGANVGRNGWHLQNDRTKKTDGKCSANPSDFGMDLCALAAPGETRTYTWYAKKEGTYFFYSMGAPAGGEGDGGQLGLGLFGAVNVQPKDAKWYRSQVTRNELTAATIRKTKYAQPVINYEAPYQNTGEALSEAEKAGLPPILNMLKCSGANAINYQRTGLCKTGGEIVHSDLNAVIDIDRENGCEQMGEGNACGKPYREFTVIFHDEVTAVQAFEELDREDSALSSLRDGMGINYGASGLGPMVVANRKKVGPARDCAECKLEEFFLTSWVNGDPAMVVGYKTEPKYKRDAIGNLVPRKDENGKQVIDENGEPLYEQEAEPKPVLDKQGNQVFDANGRPLFEKEAKYPDDPSNVHHSYLGDPIRFRNMHAGPKETHVFHLHAHQWVEDKHDPLSHYLDSQTISPGTAFSYEVHYGGSGNRNLGPGDSIFHCHLYPHFAQGMWELWRTHDVFEDGSRRLKDYDIKEGTPIPAVVPLPRIAMPPMPTDKFRGYPFYVAGEIGHRPPQPPLDLDVKDVKREDYRTLQRHIVTAATVRDKEAAHGPEEMRSVSASPDDRDLFNVGRKESAKIAKRVWSQNSATDLISLARELDTATTKRIDMIGTTDEQAAMQFHGGTATVHNRPAVGKGAPGWSHTPYNWEAPGYPSCLPEGTCDDKDESPRVLFHVNGGGNVEKESTIPPRKVGEGVAGAPFSNPCPKEWVDENGMVRSVKVRQYRAVYIQMDMTVNKSGWHDPQARFPVLEKDVRDTLEGSRPTEPLFFRAQSGECVEFYATNLIPSNLNLDDFQAYSPTDTIGQHIHLVKFDVTSSDGSGNGWNYEDGTLAADEIRERIIAHNRHLIKTSMPTEKLNLLEPKTHPLFLKGGSMYDDQRGGDKRGICQNLPMDRNPGESNQDWMKRWEAWGQKATKENPWCGAQTTIQRWWADPILNGKPGDKKTKDRTMRTVFTHDHFGPSSHQHHGFYAALVIEPTNSKWYFPDGRLMGGTDKDGNPKIVDNRHDGGPTSYAANIIVRTRGKACVTPEKDGTVCSDSLDSKGTIDYERTGREFNLAFADFAIVYDRENRPINPPSQIEGSLASSVLPGYIPMPEGISTKDPGTQLINYRNEPIPLRVGIQDKNGIQFKHKPEFVLNDKGEIVKDEHGNNRLNYEADLAHVFSSIFHQKQVDGSVKLFTESQDMGRHPGDPATPLLRAYEGDHVQIRLIQGAQEEQHVFTLHGAKWLAQPDSPNTGYVGAQHIGISEHFEFNDRVVEFMPFNDTRDTTKDGAKVTQKNPVDHLYSSNAVDNLWDGQWGLMRIYPRTQNVQHLVRLPGNTEKTHDVLASAFVKEELAEALDSERLQVLDGDESSKQQGQQPGPTDALEAFCQSKEQQRLVRNFEVEAWLAKDLVGGKGLVYNKAFGITDPYAILFVERNRVPDVQGEQKKPEPLILRARAGECIRVTLTNKLAEKQPRMPDWPSLNPSPSPEEIEAYQRTWSYNMVPPITPGLSFNQVRSSQRVGLHPQLVDYNLQTSDGAHVGLNDDSTVGPGESKTYLWYAGEIVSAGEGRMNRIEGRPYEFGAIPLQDMGDVIKHASHGAIGALIIEPQCSWWDETAYPSNAEKEITYWKPEPMSGRHGKHLKKQVCPFDETWSGSMRSMVHTDPVRKMPAEESGSLYRFKEMVLLYQDNLSLQQYGQPMPNLRNGDDSEDSGQKAFNYGTEPIWARLGASPADEPDMMSEYDWSNVFSSTVSHFQCHADFAKGRYCDPETPIFTAKAGDQLRFRVVHPGGHPRQHGFTLFGHDWSLSPWIDNSRTMGWNQFSSMRVGSTGGIGPGRAINIMASAGGDCAVHGDYLYRTQEGFMFGGGLWGILRVEENTSPKYHWFDWQKERWGDHKIEGDSKSGCPLPRDKSLTP